MSKRGCHNQTESDACPQTDGGTEGATRIHSSAPTSSTLLMLHKPKGYVVTRTDDRGRKTVYNLHPEWAFRDGWMPAGRLDLESRGLLLFARDGRVLDALTGSARLSLLLLLAAGLLVLGFTPNRVELGDDVVRTPHDHQPSW